MKLCVVLYCLVFIASLTSVESKTWNQLIDESYRWSHGLASDLRNQYQSISTSKNISFECNESILEFLKSVVNLDDWAIQMVNSWGHFPPSGVLIGTSTDFGSYDQCLDIEPNHVIDRAQYCLIDMKPLIPQPMPVHHNLHHPIDVLPNGFDRNNTIFPNVYEKYSEFASFYYWVSVRTGICSPSKCSQQDISQLASGLATKMGIELKQVQCQTKQTESTLSFTQFLSITIFSFTLLVTLIATFLERNAVIDDKSSKMSQFIDTFSMKRNIDCVFNERTSEVFSCIHGIRVITIIWIILGHTIEWSNYKVFSRAFQSKQIFTEISAQIVLNGFYSVENFFFIGGMLTSYITLQYTNAELSRFSTTGFLISKYLRLTPQLIFYILGIYLIPLGGWASGPIWNETMSPVIENCSERWWWNLLFIQNFVNRHQICGVHTWFLGVDMQYHWLSILFIIPILYSYKLGNAITGMSIVAFYVASVIISYCLDLPPGLVNTARDDLTPAPISPFIEYFYWMPWSHATVFLIGLMFGNFIHNRKFKMITKTKSYLVTFMITAGYLICLMDTYYWNTGRPFNRVVSAFVYSTCRLIWASSTAALIWLCISGNGGLVNDFLSAKVFTPLSRLTYSVYLTHVWVIWIFVGSRRERLDASWTDNLFIFMHNVVMSYIIGFLFTVLFEVPVLKLQKRLKNKLFKVHAEDKGDSKEQVRLRTLSKENNNIDV